MIASRSCNADRCSVFWLFELIKLLFECKLMVSAAAIDGRGEARADIVLAPPSDVPFLRRGVFVLLASDTSMLAICRMKRVNL